MYALDLACRVFPYPRPCPKGGRTCLEFGLAALIFGLTLLAVLHWAASLRPFDARRGTERERLVLPAGGGSGAV